MANGSSVAAVVFGLASAATWGTGDFSAGLATKRAPLFGVVIISQFCGLTLFVILGLLRAEALPSAVDVLWSVIAGLSGVGGLLALYSGLASGKMGLIAPISAVVSTIVPVIVGAATQGLPSALQIGGFVLAMVGIWFISRPAKTDVNTLDLRLPIIAGLGFGAFFVFIHQVNPNLFFFPLAAARMSSLLVVSTIVLSRRTVWQPTRSLLPLIAVSGIFDGLGNAFYMVSSQIGRLDLAAVLSSLYPVSTVILAAIVLKERLTRTQLINTGVILLAIVLITAS